MGKVITASTIGKLIEAHIEKNDEKFWSYVQFIEEAFRDNNDEFAARIIKKYLDGSYNNENKVEALEGLTYKRLYECLVEKIQEVASEHKYKVQGDRESYSEYNEGWQDAVNMISGAIDEETIEKPTCSYTVADALVMTEYCGKILDFCGNEINVTEENKDEIYGLLVNQICASGNDVLICTFLNEDKWLAKEEQKKKTLKELAKKFDGREYTCEQFTSEEIHHLKELGVVVLYGASDDLCEIDGAVEGEVDCYIGGSEKIEFTLAKDGPVPFGNGSNNLNKVSIAQENGCWKYHVSGLVNYSKFTIKEDGEDYCEAMLFFAEDLF